MMYTLRLNGLLTSLLVVLLSAFPVWAANLITYKPPQLGAPNARIGGGTRSLKTESVKIQALAPEQTGLTSRTAPTLYWHNTDTALRNVEFTLGLENESEPVLEKKLGPIATTGIQAIRLAELGVTLKPGVDYYWSVTPITSSPNQYGAFATATIRYVKPTTNPVSAAAMAESGYWYDALDQLIKEKSPQVESLLEQIGLRLGD